MSFTVLFVCTGNLCRSPMAARLMSVRLRPSVAEGVRVLSAGTRAVVGHEMDHTSARVLRELGGEPDDHRAQQLVPELVNDADLILTATTEHRSHVVRLVPAAMHRTFTMREFVRLGADLPPPRPGPAGGRFGRRVAEVAAGRGVLDAPEPAADEIGDPIGRPLAEVRVLGEQVSESVTGIARLLGLGR